MNPKRGLIGLFVLTFFLSGIGMAVLISDDQKDLSSRAGSVIPTNLQPALPEERFVDNHFVWSGKSENIPVEVSYDPVYWLPPKEDNVFLHVSLPVTVRFATGVGDVVRLQKIIGSDFTKPQLLSEVITTLPGWNIKSYSFTFFGAVKIVDVWSHTSGLTLISVMPDASARNDVGNLVSQIRITAGSQVKGTATEDAGARLAALVRPSVVMIVNNYCASVNANGNVYPFCLAQSGSGFFVSSDGFIATNGHVVTNLPDTTLFYAVESGSLDTLLVDYFYNYISIQTGTLANRTDIEKKVKDAHTNKETIYQMAALIKDLYTKKLIKIEKAENHFYVQLGNTPIQLSKTGVNLGPNVVIASFIDSDYAEPDPKTGFSSSDVALIKTEGSNFPALPLGGIEDVRLGSDVLVVGYPGVVMGSNSVLLDTSANAEPTFTKGVVSSFKQAKGNKKNLIQTDASINHGNSGGPGISSEGKVVGIATYGLIPETGGGNYNFLRDIADLKALMVKNNIVNTPGETFTIWQNGLDNYWVSYFKYAKTNFEKVIAAYPSHPTARNYLSDSDSKIGTPEDQTPVLTRDRRRLYINLSGATMTLSILMIIILAISTFIDSKRQRSPITIPPRQQLPPRQIQTF